jgi:hypothetical protein
MGYLHFFVNKPSNIPQNIITLTNVQIPIPKNYRMKNVFLLFGIFLVCGLPCIQAQIITTIAGTGAAGFSGDGGPAVSATLGNPRYLGLDGMGNLYFMDQSTRIRKVSTSGIITTAAGTGYSSGRSSWLEGIPATADSLVTLEAMTADLAGNFYFSEDLVGRVYKVNTAGIVGTAVGHYPFYNGYGGDGGPATSAAVGYGLYGLGADNAGNLYISDWGNKRVRKVNAAGLISTIAGNGTLGYSGDGGLATNAQLEPREIAADNAGNVYISDWNNHVVRKVNTSGIISTYAGTGTGGYGGDGGPATAAMLWGPEGLAVDTAGNLFICDYYNNRVRMVSHAGVITTIAGNGTGASAGDGGPATACSVNGPMGIAVRENCGKRLYISDILGHRIREIVYNNAFPHFAGAHTHNINICRGSAAVNLDTMLTMTDADAGQPETWALVRPPVHGTVSGGYLATSTGGSLTPSGISLMPGTSFVGNDTFRITVCDCGNAPDTATFYVTYFDDTFYASAGVITGVDTVCMGDTVLFSETISGGLWSSHTGKATALAAGGVAGIAPGRDTIVYTLSSPCGTVLTSRPVYVKSCPSVVPEMQAVAGLFTWPNPARGLLHILLNSAVTEDVPVTIWSITGQKIWETTIVSNKETNVQMDMPEGLYLLSVKTNEGAYQAKVAVMK